MRIGHGYDIHMLVPQRPCILSGVEFPCEAGPEGHSDGDVVLHALCDALLGAIAGGDLGLLFGTAEPEFKNAPSRVFVERVCARLGPLKPVNVDVTVTGARPRISGRRDEMRAVIAQLLGIDISAVSVKASSGNGVGECGRGEAVEATAVVLLETAAP